MKEEKEAERWKLTRRTKRRWRTEGIEHKGERRRGKGGEMEDEEQDEEEEENNTRNNPPKTKKSRIRRGPGDGGVSSVRKLLVY